MGVGEDYTNFATVMWVVGFISLAYALIISQELLRGVIVVVLLAILFYLRYAVGLLKVLVKQNRDDSQQRSGWDRESPGPQD